MIEKAKRGIESYLAKYKKPEFQWFHNGFFSPRYHGKEGRERALYYLELLNSKGIKNPEKAKVLYALFGSYDGATLKDEILKSFNQTNDTHIRTTLSQLITDNEISNSFKGPFEIQHDRTECIGQINNDIGHYVRQANGVEPKSPRR